MNALFGDPNDKVVLTKLRELEEPPQHSEPMK